MEKSKLNLFFAVNGEKFAPEMIPHIKSKLEKMDDGKLLMLQATEFRNPTIILVIAILLGWDRFFLDDIGLGILKILTCQGLGIWWIIDIISAKKRTYDYNLNKFNIMSQF